MHGLCRVLSYIVIFGFLFAALRLITRVGRGWGALPLGFALLIGVNVPIEWWHWTSSVPEECWAAVSFSASAVVFVALVLALSREQLSHRVFLAVSYAAFSAWHIPVFYLLVFRNPLALPKLGAVLLGLTVYSTANLVFLVWFRRWVPRTARYVHWRLCSSVAGVVFVSLYVSGIWPISIITAPLRYCSAFVWATLMTWVLFPLLLRILHVFRREAALARGLAIVKTEAKLRRDSVALARQMRHDQRHHSAQLMEYLRKGEGGKALAYLENMEKIAERAAKNRILWCENETVSAILSSCARKARSTGVTLMAMAEVGPTVPFEDAELVAVLANLLENAILATKRGTVRVGIRQLDFGLGIRITNPVPEGFALSSRGLPCTEPGLGMESVRQVVNKYHGSWKYTLEDGHLVCQVTLRSK